jgi:hypothetical protein
MHYVYRNTWVARVFRTVWHTESREHAVSYARAAVDGLSSVAARVAVEKQPVPDEIRTELLGAAMGARDGLMRLSRTYESDVGVSSALASQATRIAVLCRFMTSAHADKRGDDDHATGSIGPIGPIGPSCHSGPRGPSGPQGPQGP